MRRDVSETPRVGRIGRAPLALALALNLVTLACLSSQPKTSGGQEDAGGQRRLGSFAFSSALSGALTLAPSYCTSGDRQRFLGADFAGGESGLTVRLVVDPLDGPAVRVFSDAAPFEKSVVFRRSECRVFHFSLDDTGWRVNGVHDYAVTLDLDCTNKSGDSLTGKSSASHCH